MSKSHGAEGLSAAGLLLPCISALISCVSLSSSIAKSCNSDSSKEMQQILHITDSLWCVGKHHQRLDAVSK